MPVLTVRNLHLGLFPQEDLIARSGYGVTVPKLDTKDFKVAVDEFNLEHLLTRHGEQDVCTLSTANYQRCLAVPLFDDL